MNLSSFEQERYLVPYHLSLRPFFRAVPKLHTSLPPRDFWRKAPRAVSLSSPSHSPVT